MLGNILLGIVSFCTFISYFPQIVKLLKTKEANDFSIPTCFLWLISSLAYTLYAIIVSGDKMLIFETCLESSFCFVILTLAFKYRKKRRARRKKTT